MSKSPENMTLRELGLEYSRFERTIKSLEQDLKGTIELRNSLHDEICSRLTEVPNAGFLDVILTEGGTAFLPHWEFGVGIRCNDFTVASELNGNLVKIL